MSQYLFLSASGLITGDTAVLANGLVVRDGNGDAYARRFTTSGTGQGVRNGGHTFSHVLGATTSFQIDNSTYNGTIIQEDATAGALVRTLPSAATSADQILTFTKIDATVNTITITQAASDVINGAATYVLRNQYDSVTLYCDGTNWYITAERFGRSGLVASAVAATSALTASSTETVFNSYTIPANTLKAGDLIVMEGQGIATGHNGSDTLTVRARIGSAVLGGTQLFSLGAVNFSANDIWFYRLRLKVRTIGASGTFVANGTGAFGTPLINTTPIMSPFFVASTAFDTTGALIIGSTGQFSSTNGTNSCREDDNDVQVIRKARAL